MYLYHATDKKNLDSIMKSGLLTSPPHHNWEGMHCEGKVFLAFDAAVAEDYVMSSENPPEEAVILKIPLDTLAEDQIGYDWNNRCEYVSDINSCTYSLDISPDCIFIALCNEPAQTLEDFKGTEFYERVIRVFEEEVESNLEQN